MVNSSLSQVNTEVGELLHVPKSMLVYWGQEWLFANLDWVLLAVQWLWVRIVGRVCVMHSLDSWFYSVFVLVSVLFDAAKVEQVKFDTTQLHARPELAAEQRMVDDASGEIEVRQLLWLARML